MAYGTRLLRLDEHREALAALWRENMSDARIGDVVPERIRWLYERNPAGSAITWLGVVTGSESVVGCGTVFPRRVLVDGLLVSAGVLADFAVTKTHRVAGAALAIQRAVAKGSFPAGVQFLYGYPNAKSVAIFERLGYRRVGESTFWVKPLRSAYKVRERVQSPVFAGALSTVLDGGLDVADKALALVHRARRRVRGDNASYETVEVERADARFDDLWTRARTAFSVMGEKTAAYLNWRYTDFTTRRHDFFCLLDRATGQLCAYAVYSVHEDKALIADLFGERLDVTATELLLRLSQHLRRKGVSSLMFSYLGPDDFGETLKASGFLRRPGARSMIAYVDSSSPEGLRRAVFDRDAWFMIDGELDI